jgi:hypothetical protein
MSAIGTLHDCRRAQHDVRPNRLAGLGTAMLLGVVSCSSLGRALGPVISDRPGFTDTPSVLPAGGIELETGLTADDTPGVRYTSIGETLVRVGVGAGLEARLFGNSYARRREDGGRTAQGFEDPKLGIKLRVRDLPDSVHAFVPRVALLLAAALPVPDSPVASRRVLPEGKFALSWTLPHGASFFSNVGYAAVVADDGSRRARPFVTGAAWYAASPKLSLFLEAFDARGDARHSVAPARLGDAGVTRLLSDRLQVDVRIGRSLRRDRPERFTGLGLARRW